MQDVPGYVHNPRATVAEHIEQADERKRHIGTSLMSEPITALLTNEISAH